MNYVGKYVVVRARGAGVFAGTLKEKDGNEVVLNDARRLWYWAGANECTEIARSGVKEPNQCKFTVPVGEICILDVVEVIPCTEEAERIIKAVPEWKA